MFSQVTAVAVLASRLAIILNGKASLLMYKKDVDESHALTPMTAAEADRLKSISFLSTLCFMLLSVPINMLRTWFLLNVARSTVVFKALVYVQNFSMYCVESQFSILCFVLYQKFDGINRDLMALKVDVTVRNKYPFLSEQTGEKYGGIAVDDGGARSAATTDYNGEVLRALADGRPMVGFIEELQIKHRLVREAVKYLNAAFGFHMGLSLCSLCLFTMLDIYYNILHIIHSTKLEIMYYGWILQYSYRFIIVTVIAHITTKQVIPETHCGSDIPVHNNIANVLSCKIDRD